MANPEKFGLSHITAPEAFNILLGASGGDVEFYANNKPFFLNREVMMANRMLNGSGMSIKYLEREFTEEECCDIWRIMTEFKWEISFKAICTGEVMQELIEQGLLEYIEAYLAGVPIEDIVA